MNVSHDCLPRLVERYAFENPEARAVLWCDDALSYAELNSRSNQLAHYLETRGVGPDVIVGLCLPRGLDMIVALLAILKTGAAYLPLDSGYPTERLRRVVNKAVPKILITENFLAKNLDIDIPTLCLKASAVKINLESTVNLSTPIYATQLCYVIFTSGSTGEPKGVAVTHGNVARIFDDIGSKFSIESTDVWSQIHSVAFGFSVFEIWGALIHGACIAIAPETARGDIFSLREYLIRNNVTILSQTPSAFRETILTHMFIDKWKELSVRVLFLSGEGVQANDLRRWSDQTSALIPRLVNTYAITETGGNVMLREYSSGDLDAKNIGKSLSHVKIYVLDEAFQPVPVGSPGELYVGGEGVAAGYINDTELTKNRFINLPNINGRLYRTGDIVKELPDSSLDFLGRKDNQIKWRGFRLELGELESILSTHPGISAAAADIRTDDMGNDKLVAYIVPAPLQEAEFWPSIGGYQIYDDFLYDLMSTDNVRNSAFSNAFEQCARDRVVLDLGTGPHALLAQLAARAGAKKVYAVEVLSAMAKKARIAVQASGQADRITVIEGDATILELPERAEVCTQGIIGNIGSADGIAPIWNSIRKQLGADCTPVPQRCMTMIAAVELPDELRDSPEFSTLAQGYLEKIFAKEGRSFDPRLCIRNLAPGQIISDCHVFEDLDFCHELPEFHKGRGDFKLNRAGRFDGFLLWTVVTVTNDIKLDYLEHQHAWLPVFMPLTVKGYDLPVNTIISSEWEWSTVGESIFPDYSIRAEFEVSGQKKYSNYTTHHHEKTLGGTPIHRQLVEFKHAESLGLSAKEMRIWLNKHLPESLLPNAWVILEELPLNINGKLDRNALPEPVQHVSDVLEVAPRTPLEKDLVTIWSDVLGISSIGVDNDFFTLGGDSIRSIRLTSQVQQFFNIDIALTAIFDNRTIANFSRFMEQHFQEALDARYQTGDESFIAFVEQPYNEKLIDSLSSDGNSISPVRDIDHILERQRSLIASWSGKRQSSESFIFTFNESGVKPALFWCFQSDGEHKKLSIKLGLDQPLHGMRSGHLLMDYNDANVAALAEYYAAEIIQLQPDGPYYLGGNCQGGILANAIALCLLRLGKEVGLLLLMEVNQFEEYPEPVALLFGRDSHVNPYKSGYNPEGVFRESYPKGFTVSFINGAHGEFFQDSNISSLVEVISLQLACVSENVTEKVE